MKQPFICARLHKNDDGKVTLIGDPDSFANDFVVKICNSCASINHLPLR